MQAPERIDNDTAQGRLWLHWAEAVVTFSHVTLREACRCAACQFKRHHRAPINVGADVRVTTIEPAGYGVQLVFSDGHARGIYPWAYLAELAATAAAG